MKFSKFISNNLVLKITSLNSVVIITKLFFGVFVQRLLALALGEVGIARIGQLRNAIDILSSFSTIGVSSGIVKYVSEFKEDNQALAKVFSTVFVITVFASFVSMVVLFFGASYFSIQLFNDTGYTFVIKILALIMPFFALKSVGIAIINGLSAYKVFAKVELIAYILSSVLLVIALYTYSLDGVLAAIAITPILYFFVLAFIYGKAIKGIVNPKRLKISTPFLKNLLSFSVMTVVAQVLSNYVEIGLRKEITEKISELDAGCWTAMTNLSKNYMVFAFSIFSLYILPKYATIQTAKLFTEEVFRIYKTLLPFYAIGMVIIYVFRINIINFVYPDFVGLESLFKWQLMADFVRLASVIVAYQFLAKKMVLAFVVSEVFSVLSFYFLAIHLINVYGIQGVVMANLIRYILYFVLVIVLVGLYFKQNKN